MSFIILFRFAVNINQGCQVSPLRTEVKYGKLWLKIKYQKIILRLRVAGLSLVLDRLNV